MRNPSVYRLASGLGSLLMLSFGLVVGAAFAPFGATHAQPPAPGAAAPGGPPSPAGAAPAVADAARLGEAFAHVAEQISPSVVSLRVQVVRPQQQRRSPFGFFGDGPNRPQQGQGSGVIIRADGYVLTNNHVVEGATRIDVVLQDGRVLEGEIVGTDAATDLAGVRVEGRNLPAASFASSDAARVGEWVVAVGSPFGLDYTVTAGVLSAKGRGGLGANEIEDYLQTDASINPGNSGGPLVNLRGQILGINTMIIGRGTGIGFAIPATMAQHVATELISNRQVRRAWLGVGFQELTPELASHFRVNDRRGALVSNVLPNGPAAAAGVQPGDVIVAIDGDPVAEGRDLLRRVLRTPVGSDAELGVLRRGQPRSLTVTLAERPERQGRRAQRRRAAPPSRHQDDLGMNLAPLTPQLRQRLGYQGSGRVVVSGVAPGTSAARAGLRRGDVIVEADGQPVHRASQVAQAFRDGAAVLRVERGDGAFFAVVERQG